MVVDLFVRRSTRPTTGTPDKPGMKTLTNSDLRRRFRQVFSAGEISRNTCVRPAVPLRFTTTPRLDPALPLSISLRGLSYQYRAPTQFYRVLRCPKPRALLRLVFDWFSGLPQRQPIDIQFYYPISLNFNRFSWVGRAGDPDEPSKSCICWATNIPDPSLFITGPRLDAVSCHGRSSSFSARHPPLRQSRCPPPPTFSVRNRGGGGGYEGSSRHPKSILTQRPAARRANRSSRPALCLGD